MGRQQHHGKRPLKQFINVTWVNEPVSPWGFTDEDMWGEFWKKHGK